MPQPRNRRPRASSAEALLGQPKAFALSVARDLLGFSFEPPTDRAQLEELCAEAFEGHASGCGLLFVNEDDCRGLSFFGDGPGCACGASHKLWICSIPRDLPDDLVAGVLARVHASSADRSKAQ